jgi:adenine-specific DNA-methyltransferase
VLTRAWAALSAEKAGLERQLRDGRWTNVVKRVDEVLLQDVLGLPPTDVIELHQAARTLRAKRIGPEFGDDI